MKYSDYQTERKTLAKWAAPSAAGHARSAFKAALAALQNGPVVPVLTIDFGRARYTIGSDGNEFAHAVDDTVELDDSKGSLKPGDAVKFPVGVHIDTGIPNGSAPTNKVSHGLRIPNGVAIVIGGANAAKTPVTHMLAGLNDADYAALRYGEPLSGYLADEKLGAKALAECLFYNSDVVLDSVKDILALATGGAMKSGISRGALPLLSRWGAVAASVGSTLYIPLNPSSADQEVVDLLVEAAQSNATMTISVVADGVWKYSSRRGEGLKREGGTFVTSFTGDGTMAMSRAVVGSGADDLDDVESLGTVSGLSDSHLNSAIRRARFSADGNA